MRFILYFFLSFLLLPSTLSSNEDRVNFVSVGERGTILVSNDGIKWKKVKTNITVNLYEVIYGYNLYIIIGQSGTTFKSVNGNIWDEIPKLDYS